MELQWHKGKHLFVGPNLAVAALRAESTLMLRDQIHLFPLYSQLSQWLWELQLLRLSRQQHRPGFLPNPLPQTTANQFGDSDNQLPWLSASKAVSQWPCIASRFFINLSEKALVPVLPLIPGTAQSGPDLSDRGRDWPGGHFCSPTCRSPPYQIGPRLLHCSSQGCCQLLLPAGHWPLSPYIYSPKETLSAATANAELRLQPS